MIRGSGNGNQSNRGYANAVEEEAIRDATFAGRLRQLRAELM